MPTPARRAISSSGASTPSSVKTSAATSSTFARLRAASARIFGGAPSTTPTGDASSSLS